MGLLWMPTLLFIEKECEIFGTKSISISNGYWVWNLNNAQETPLISCWLKISEYISKQSDLIIVWKLNKLKFAEIL